MKRIFVLWTVCTVALCASATLRYVKPDGSDSNNGQSWATAKKTITGGMSGLSAGDTVLVAAGTYNERVSLKDGVSILGGYNAATGARDIDQYETILDGTGLTKYFLYKNDAPPTNHILVEGLTIQNGNHATSGTVALYWRGNMTLNRCHILNCRTTSSSSTAGAIYLTQGDATVQAVISNCVIELCSGNQSGVVYNNGGLIENCIFRGCTTDRAIVRNYSTTSVMRNCLLYNNTITGASSKGAIENNGVVYNCTVCNNEAQDYAGIYTNSTGQTYNSVFWGNKSSDSFADPANYLSSSSSSSHNVADQGTSSSKFITTHLAADNFAADGPNFGNPTSFVGAPKTDGEIMAMRYADFSLTTASTALLNQGLATGAPATDLAGVTRPKGSGTDIGAYEYNPSATTIAVQSVSIMQDTLFVSQGMSGAFAVFFVPANATDKRLIWTVDNTAVATISNGLVTGVTVGTTVAHVESQDGHFTDEAVIVVRPQIFPHEVLDADANYHIEDYTIPSFIEFLVAKEEARIDSLTCEDMSLITTKLAALADKIAHLKSKYEPYNMIATFNGDPRTQMGFCWFTNGDVSNGVVELLPVKNATAADFADSEDEGDVMIVQATATTTMPLHYTPYQVTESPKYDICGAAGLPFHQTFTYVSHKALAQNLIPGKTYSWRVGYAGHWSEISEFVTPSDNQGDFSFVYMTDSHIQDAEYIENARWCANAVVKNESDVKFCVFPGDFVDTGGETNSEWQWERWFEGSMRPVLKKMALVPTDGNHDDSPSLNYDYHFNTDWGFSNAAQTKPQFKGITYSFVYGDVLFLVYSLQDWWRASGSSDKQMKSSYITTDLRNWFLDQVEAHPNTKYRVTISHKNVFSGSGHHKDDESAVIRELMLPILKECEIDLAIQGHDHCYEVIGPVDPDTKTVVAGAVSGVQTVDGGTSVNMTGKEGGTFTTDGGTLYFIGATCGRKRYSPSTREKLESQYTTDPDLLVDNNHHNVQNLFDLFTSMYGQPGAPSYSRFNVTSNGIEVKSYKTDNAGNSQLYNTIVVKRNTPHSNPTGIDNTSVEKVQNGQKFIRNGQLYILKDGVIYNMMGQKMSQE